MSEAAMKIPVHIFQWTCVRISLGVLWKNETTELQNGYIFSCRRYCQIVSTVVVPIYAPTNKCMRVPDALLLISTGCHHHYQFQFWPVNFIWFQLSGKYGFYCGFNSISLRSKDVWNPLFISLLAISLVKCLFKSFVHIYCIYPFHVDLQGFLVFYGREFFV